MLASLMDMAYETAKVIGWITMALVVILAIGGGTADCDDD